jgi:hypothetical protein
MPYHSGVTTGGLNNTALPHDPTSGLGFTTGSLSTCSFARHFYHLHKCKAPDSKTSSSLGNAQYILANKVKFRHIFNYKYETQTSALLTGVIFLL